MDAAPSVIAAVVVISGSAVIKDSAKGNFTIKPVIGGFLLGSALLLVAMVSPSLAKGFALLGIVGAVATNGPDLLKAVNKIGTTSD